MDGGGLGGFRWTAEEASTIGGIATVSLLHSFIPTHWLPFSIVARAQRWPLSRTLLVSQYPPPLPSFLPRASFSPVAAIAARYCLPPPDLVHSLTRVGEGSRPIDRGKRGSLGFYSAAFGGVLHVVSTALLGITAVTMANTIAGEETVHKLASLLLIFLGGSYILLFAIGKGGHSHAHNHPMEKMAVAGLVLVPALSPCATTLPVFLAVGNSSSMMILAIIVLLFSTITVMTSLVALSFYGASQIKFHWVERYDKILVGTVLCLVGVLTYVFHHHDGDEHSLHEHVHRKLVSP
ncbi:unnamed protein product [Miscanthus lutarioriparius]|uniref:Uncharacterized protein n=1 Tax=Miscanthus lutarioriparius TaxID=422564 RepID=A0A811P7F5_9POAL|nr:unnamed protein product [Miscanthus lutarioriparius]